MDKGGSSKIEGVLLREGGPLKWEEVLKRGDFF